MLIYYAADMHGSEQVWRKFINAGKFYGADVLILGGDITGKVLVPLVEEKPGRFVAQVFGRVEKVKRQDDLEALEKSLRFNGFYPYRCSVEEHERLADDVDYRDVVIKKVMIETVRRWVVIADEKLAGTGVHLYAIPGNDDAFDIDDALSGEHVTRVDNAVVQVDGYQLLSSSWGNPSPWHTPREKQDPELLEMFRGLTKQLDPEQPAIFNLHVPPYDSGLDTGPEVAGVDESGQVIVKKLGGQPSEVPVGSRAVREIIEECQPVLGLHSHIHESKNAVKIGQTLCLNPGSSYQDGVLDGALVELNGTEVVRYQLVSG